MRPKCIQTINIWGYPLPLSTAHMDHLVGTEAYQQQHSHYEEESKKACVQHICTDDEFVLWAQGVRYGKMSTKS